MDKRISFVFYRSFYDAVLLLEPKEQLETLLALCAYALDGIEPSFTGPPAAVFAIARANLDANQRRYENGKKGGRPKAESKKQRSRQNRRFCQKQPTITKSSSAGITVSNLMKL